MSERGGDGEVSRVGAKKKSHGQSNSKKDAAKRLVQKVENRNRTRKKKGRTTQRA